MTWEEYYEKTNDWSVSTSVKYLSSLENLGSPNEIADVINILAFEDKKGATRLLNKAIKCGIKFSGEELVDIYELCDTECFKEAVYMSADKFTAKDLEDLYLCIEAETIIEIAKKYHLSIPEEIADEYEEILCQNITEPIGWSKFYDSLYNWSTDYAIKRSKCLSSFGDEDEVIEVVNELYMTDKCEASKFIKKAVKYGVKFNVDNLIELTYLCDKETVELAVLSSGTLLSQEDLEELDGNIEDKVQKNIKKAIRQVEAIRKKLVDL